MASVRPTALHLHPVCPEVSRPVPHFLSRVDSAPRVFDCSTCGANDPSIHPLACGECKAPACFVARAGRDTHDVGGTSTRGSAGTSSGPGAVLARLAARAVAVLAGPVRWFPRKSAQGGCAARVQAREPRARLPETAA